MSLKVTQPKVATGVGDITDRVEALGLGGCYTRANTAIRAALPGRVGIIGEEGLVQVKALGNRMVSGNTDTHLHIFHLDIYG